MSKKMVFLALSVVSGALFILPAVASATPAHISATENFTVTKGVTETTTFETTSGEKFECHKGVTGVGSWHSTTTGTLTLEFHECTTTVFGSVVTCTTDVAEGGTGISGTVSTTHLPFHLIMPEPKGQHAGMLITPTAGTNNHFATFTCGGGLVTKKVTGNGIIGMIASPTCGTASTTATLKFEQGATTGVQKYSTYTGATYGLLMNGTAMAQVGERRLHFGSAKSILCT
jgi:hypothetical protein